MRKNIFLLVLLMHSVTLFSQAPASQITLKEDYLGKSKNQKKVANILLFGGSALVATAFIFPRGKAESSGGSFLYWTTYKNDGIKGGLFYTGVLSMLTSVPFYIISGKNKRRARAITVNVHNRDQLIPNHSTLLLERQPAVTFKLPL